VQRKRLLPSGPADRPTDEIVLLQLLRLDSKDRTLILFSAKLGKDCVLQGCAFCCGAVRVRFIAQKTGIGRGIDYGSKGKDKLHFFNKDTVLTAKVT
jgi:hypothetical protein